MNKYIVAAMLLSAPAFGANGILIQINSTWSYQTVRYPKM
jgi:hypothetical protein